MARFKLLACFILWPSSLAELNKSDASSEKWLSLTPFTLHEIFIDQVSWFRTYCNVLCSSSSTLIEHVANAFRSGGGVKNKYACACTLFEDL